MLLRVISEEFKEEGFRYIFPPGGSLTELVNPVSDSVFGFKCKLALATEASDWLTPFSDIVAVVRANFDAADSACCLNNAKWELG